MLCEVVKVVDMVGVGWSAWFSEKHRLLIAPSEGSLSGPVLISDLLPAVVAVVVVAAAALVAEAVDGVGSVGVCAVEPLVSPFGFLSISLSSVSSLVSCWYMSSTMGFHNRTLALMNQFET